METYEEFILRLTNKARQKCLSEIEAGILRDNGQVAQLQAELDRLRWIPVDEGPPEYIKGTNCSPDILILDGGKVAVGNYRHSYFEYWHSGFCNLDDLDSQKNITHWMPLPKEPEGE